MNSYPYNYNPYTGLAKDLEEYINDELGDSEYYLTLAMQAPTARAKEIILEFSREERMHADYFMEAYYRLTGQRYNPEPAPTPRVPQYEDALKDRIIAETNDYRKYGIKYLETRYNIYLSDLFFMTRTSEAIHAMRIPILFEEEID